MDLSKAPFPSIGLPSPSTTLPNNSFPTGVSTILPVLFTTSPSLIFRSSPKSLISSLFASSSGSEAFYSNRMLSKLFRKSLKKNRVDENFVQFIDIKRRTVVDFLLTKMSDFIDVLIPRGGKSLVKKVQKLSTIPTIGHLEQGSNI